MDISDCSFGELSYSKLLTTYLTDYKKLEPFFAFNPLDDNDIGSKADLLNTHSNSTKERFLKALSAYHKELGIDGSQQKQLEKFSDTDAVAVVTGQQLGIFGGPLFTVYKTISAILLARKYEKILERPVVPVFWLADEDHDFDEIAWTGIPGADDFRKIKLNEQGNGQPVARQLIPESLRQLEEEVKKELHETDFSEEVWDQFHRHYAEGKTHAQAFAGLINEWFAEEGLLIAGSNHPEIKSIVEEDFVQSIEDADDIFEAIEGKSRGIEKTFHRQVMNGDSNLFYISDEKGRLKIHKSERGWSAGDISWQNGELLDAVRANPERFSPNVFLRPIIQDKLIPTLGYVAGPGELAYYAQMKDLYEVYDLQMPVIFPRLCATLIETGIERAMEKLPFSFSEYEKRIEDLETEFVERTETEDLEKVFNEWKQSLRASAENPLGLIKEIDPTLEGTAGKTLAGFENELDKLKGRLYRSIKHQQEIQIKRIEKIKVNLFPDGLQERAVSPLYFMNKYGPDIWKNLMEEIESEGLDLTKHHLIKL